jgi:hypothetical protein
MPAIFIDQQLDKAASASSGVAGVIPTRAIKALSNWIRYSFFASRSPNDSDRYSPHGRGARPRNSHWMRCLTRVTHPRAVPS